MESEEGRGEKVTAEVGLRGEREGRGKMEEGKRERGEGGERLISEGEKAEGGGIEVRGEVNGGG